MAVSPLSYLPSKMNSAQPSLSCTSKVYAGLGAQSPNCLGAVKPSLNAEFRNKAYKSIESCKGKATRGRFSMMPIGVPRVLYRNEAEGTRQWVDMWNALYRERIIFIGQYIDEEFSNQILTTMLYLDTIDDLKKLNIFLSSSGGEFTSSMAIYDTMGSLRSPIGTVNMGFAFNLAGFILAAGDKGQRSAMPLSRITLESPVGGARGQADDVQNETKELLRMRDYLFEELAQNTGQPVEKIYKDLAVVKHFDAYEAIEYGLVDRMVKRARLKTQLPQKHYAAGLG